ncbi:MAG: hypothetical protein EOO15_22060 [Chitinophagaceae bacterium]|nr:MAG: hypothetical protein EOO15_22060 [Chitinophagaceae bacterium]
MDADESTLVAALEHSYEISRFIAATLGSTASLNRSERLAIASLNLCLDHREATLLLATHGARSSAFAMMRPVFEACVRGCWFGFVATESQINAMFADRFSPKLEKMVRAIGEQEPALKVLWSIATTFKEQLDHFTHGSGSQLARWYNHEALAPNHTASEVIDVLRFIDTIALIACAAREKLCQRPTEPFLEKLVAAGSHERKIQC